MTLDNEQVVQKAASPAAPQPGSIRSPLSVRHQAVTRHR